MLSALFSDVVDSFHFRAVWILSARRLSGVRFVSRCCGFFGFDVIIVVVVVIVVMNITVSRSPHPVQLEGMHRRPRTAFTVARPHSNGGSGRKQCSGSRAADTNHYHCVA